jgi:hypothetical protein
LKYHLITITQYDEKCQTFETVDDLLQAFGLASARSDLVSAYAFKGEAMDIRLQEQFLVSTVIDGQTQTVSVDKFDAEDVEDEDEDSSSSIADELENISD